MSYFAHIPWYASVFRGDQFGEIIGEIAETSMKYGANSYEVFRSSEDPYKFLQIVEFDEKIDFERYWEGREFRDFRARYEGYFQIPVYPVWNEQIAVDRKETSVVE